MLTGVITICYIKRHNHKTTNSNDRKQNEKARKIKPS